MPGNVMCYSCGEFVDRTEATYEDRIPFRIWCNDCHERRAADRATEAGEPSQGTCPRPRPSDAEIRRLMAAADEDNAEAARLDAEGGPHADTAGLSPSQEDRGR